MTKAATTILHDKILLTFSLIRNMILDNGTLPDNAAK